ncbi:MAG TPA: hypothetical protein VFP43_06710, partial [Mesorhizobium sp.]|nr:hypothetical protein [Mesorhizobium sp.]
MTLTLFLSIGAFDFATMVVAVGSTLCRPAPELPVSDRAIAAPLAAMKSRFIHEHRRNFRSRI